MNRQLDGTDCCLVLMDTLKRLATDLSANGGFVSAWKVSRSYHIDFVSAWKVSRSYHIDQLRRQV